MKPSRRNLLRVIGAVAALRIAKPAAAQTKVSQQDAQYQLRPKHNMSCAMCQLFRPPNACAIVAGDIAPQGWCKFFSLPD